MHGNLAVQAEASTVAAGGKNAISRHRPRVSASGQVFSCRGQEIWVASQVSLSQNLCFSPSSWTSTVPLHRSRCARLYRPAARRYPACRRMAGRRLVRLPLGNSGDRRTMRSLLATTRPKKPMRPKKVAHGDGAGLAAKLTATFLSSRTLLAKVWPRALKHSSKRACSRSCLHLLVF